MSEVTVFMDNWTVTNPAPMTKACKSALSLKPQTPVLSRPRWKRRRRGRGKEKIGLGEEGRDSMRCSLMRRQRRQGRRKEGEMCEDREEEEKSSKKMEKK